MRNSKKNARKKGINPKQVSPKFLAQFVEASSLDEEDDIQEIWSDILTKEAQSPGSISLRTISSLRSLSKEEASTFRSLYDNVLQFSDGSLAIYNDRSGDKNSIADIIKLVDCGLLVSESASITMNVTIPKKLSSIAYLSPMGKYIVVAQNAKENEQKCVIPIFSLTQAGQDILRATLPDDKENNSPSMAKKDERKNNSLTIRLFKVENYGDNTGQVSYSGKDLLQE